MVVEIGAVNTYCEQQDSYPEYMTEVVAFYGTLAAAQEALPNNPERCTHARDCCGQWYVSEVTYHEVNHALVLVVISRAQNV